MKIDMGCGNRCRPGFIGIDRDKSSNAKYILDAEKEPLPFKDDSVDEVYSYHMFEYMTDMVFVLKEICRVCKNGALVNIYVTHRDSEGSSCPLHRRTFTEHTFDWFDAGKGRFENSNPPDGINLHVVSAKTIRGRLRPWKKYSIHFTLRVIKDKRPETRASPGKKGEKP